MALMAAVAGWPGRLQPGGETGLLLAGAYGGYLASTLWMSGQSFLMAVPGG